jgi:transposase InsO family protein
MKRTPSHLNHGFSVKAPNKAWVTAITYIRTWQGWLYSAVVVGLYARKVVCCPRKQTQVRELTLDALMMGLWQRKPRALHDSVGVSVLRHLNVPHHGGGKCLSKRGLPTRKVQGITGNKKPALRLVFMGIRSFRYVLR